jgi:SAM-dependent methyltransferase
MAARRLKPIWPPKQIEIYARQVIDHVAPITPMNDRQGEAPQITTPPQSERSLAKLSIIAQEERAPLSRGWGRIGYRIVHCLYRLPILGYALRNAALLVRLPILFDNLRDGHMSMQQSLNSMQHSMQQSSNSIQQSSNSMQQSLNSMQQSLNEVSRGVQEIYPALTHLQEVLREADVTATANNLADLRRLVISTLAGPTAVPARETKDAATAEPESLTHDRADESLYVSFQERFRGSRSDIKNRQRVYLPLIAEATAVADGGVLDVGCGRGEWLELLQENRITARGIDINSAMVDDCRALGLQVEIGDAVKYLQGLPTDTLGAVTAFHVIEHLPPPVLITFLDEGLRVLQPGGIIILETPNPANLQVGAHTFWLDQTHVKPIPSATAAFLLEARGYVAVQILALHAMPEAEVQYDNPLLNQLNQLLHGPQDYAVVGKK